MSKYIIEGKVLKVSSSSSLVVKETMPVGRYRVEFSPLEGFSLVQEEAFQLPGKLYGDVEGRAQRILKTYKARGRNTGVLLSGEKGSGKTMLAHQISREAAKQGMSTLVVSSAFEGAHFGKLLTDIDCPCVVLFDEFEKLFRGQEDQETYLTLLDGTIQCNKLFVLTINDSWRLNSFLLNRPGRIFYHYKYRQVGDDLVTGYCADHLNRKEWAKDIMSLSKMTSSFNFDMLKALVEECNIHNEPPFTVHHALNIDVLEGSRTYEYILTKTGSATRRGDVSIDVNIQFSMSWDDNPEDMDAAVEEILFRPEDCQKFDRDAQHFTYKQGDFLLELRCKTERPSTHNFLA